MISVVLTSYNYSKYIQRSINAIIEQTVKPTEFIIIDDCSIDDSPGIIEGFIRQYPFIKFIRNNENKGVIWSIQHGLFVAKNPYILFSTADDYIYPNLIQASLDLLQQYPMAGFSTAKAHVCSESYSIKETWNKQGNLKNGYVDPQQSRIRLMKYGLNFVGVTTIFNKTLLENAGGFNADLGHYCDSFVSQVLALKHGYCYLNDPLACIRVSKTSFSQNMKNDIAKELKLLDNVVELVRTNYTNLFPTSFASQWYKLSKLLLIVNNWKNDVFLNQQVFFYHNIHKVNNGRSFFAHVFLLPLKLSSWIQLFLVMAYATILLGRGSLLIPYLWPNRLLRWIKRFKK